MRKERKKQVGYDIEVKIIFILRCQFVKRDNFLNFTTSLTFLFLMIPIKAVIGWKLTTFVLATDVKI